MTNEDLNRIYQEEKVRAAARRKIAGPSLGRIVGMTLLSIFGVLVLLFIAGLFIEQADRNADAKRSPSERQADHEANCKAFREAWKYKLYSELSTEERQILASCK